MVAYSDEVLYLLVSTFNINILVSHSRWMKSNGMNFCETTIRCHRAVVPDVNSKIITIHLNQIM